MMTPIRGISAADRRHSTVLRSPVAIPRGGIMLPYEDSSRDDWSVKWFHDPHCTNGYTWLVLDDGSVVELADPGMRTPRAGACKTPMPNSVFYGIAAATNGLVPVTGKQLASIVTIRLCLFIHHRWPFDSADARIARHDAQAVWTPQYTTRSELWGRTGRKVDPTGRRARRVVGSGF
jgi:hypothetical protein